MPALLPTGEDKPRASAEYREREVAEKLVRAKEAHGKAQDRVEELQRQLEEATRAAEDARRKAGPRRACASHAGPSRDRRTAAYQMRERCGRDSENLGIRCTCVQMAAAEHKAEDLESVLSECEEAAKRHVRGPLLGSHFERRRASH